MHIYTQSNACNKKYINIQIYICVYIYIHIYICTHIFTGIYLCVYVCTDVYGYIKMQEYIYHKKTNKTTHTHIYKYVYIYICIVYMCLYICIYIYIYAKFVYSCVYIYIYIYIYMSWVWYAYEELQRNRDGQKHDLNAMQDAKIKRQEMQQSLAAEWGVPWPKPSKDGRKGGPNSSNPKVARWVV